MHEGSLSALIIVLFILIGIVSYYIFDYYKYKSLVNSEIDDTNQKVVKEKSERLGNIKSVVDQVNVVHDSIDGEFVKVGGNIKTLDSGLQNARGMISTVDTSLTKTKDDVIKLNTGLKNTNGRVTTLEGDVTTLEGDVTTIKGGVTTIQENVSTINNGIKSVMSFSTLDSNGKQTAIGMKDLPGAVNPDTKLMTHVTSVGGLTIRDLDKASKNGLSLEICAKEDPTKCIRIPDKDGNVYLTNLYKDSAISLDGSTVINAPLSFTQAGKLGARLSGENDGKIASGFMETTAFGIGNVKGKPNASLHIMSDQSTDVAPFKISVNSTDVLNVDKKGTLYTRRIELMPEGSTGTTAVLQALSDGVMIDAKNIYTNGSLYVNGLIYQSTKSATEAEQLLSKQTLVSAPAPSTSTVPSTSTTSSTTTIPSTSTTTATRTATRSISAFTNGPTKSESSYYTKKPADYMNQPYLITVQ